METQGPSQFDRTLTELKENGSSLLVVGTVPDEKFGEVTESLLGDPASGPRRRLFVTMEDKVSDIRARLPDTSLLPVRQSVRVITISDTARSTAATSGTGNDTIQIQRVATEEIDTLAQSILEKIDEFDRLAAGLEPAELRVSVEPLTTLIDAHGQEAVFRMVHLLNHIVREKKGMAHYHLPVERESGVVRMFAPLFDALIELRLKDDSLQQRWHLQDPEITSDWVEV